MSDSDGEFGAFLAGFVIGGLVGAAVALLTAPQSGEETRKYIQDKSIEIKNTTVERAEAARARAEEAAAEAKAYAEEMGSQARDRAEELRKRGQEIFADQRTKVTKVIETGKEAVQRRVRGGADDSTPEIPTES